MTSAVWTTSIIAALAIGCAPSLNPDDDGGGGGTPVGDGKIQTTDNGDGTFTTAVDGSDEGLFVYFDFESQEEVEVVKPLNSSKWDMGFQRYLFPTNGGISGPGGVVVAVIDGGDFDAIDQAPPSGYLGDLEDPPEDGDEDPDFVFNAVPTAWYAYNNDEHTLSAADRVYVLRSVEGRHFKIRFEGYYDSAGNPGFPKFTWGEIGPPSTPDSFAVNANDDWMYLSVAKGGMVAVAGDPATSDEWDLALRRTVVLTNSGTSAMGLGGARIAPGAAEYEDTSTSPTFGFDVDTMIAAPGPPGSGEVSGHPVLNAWYDYDELSHKVTTKGDVFIVRTAHGDYGKFQILYYAEGVYELRIAPVARTVTTEQRVIDGSAGWTYYSFALDRAIEPVNAATDLSWDVALNGTMVQTNSGTSGAGNGGAFDPMTASLAAIANAPTSGYVVDAQLSIDGNDFSGSAVLNGWYQSGTTTPNDVAYVLRSADGTYTKLKIGAYDNGSYTIDWAYAGPGHTDF